MKTKTFKEVVRDIKRGETWITRKEGYNLKSITWEEDSRSLEFNYSDETRSFYIDPNQEFVLKLKSYDFDEVYIDLLNGRIIQSESGNSFIMKDGKIYKFEGIHEVLCPNIECTDILGEWYIFGE